MKNITKEISSGILSLIPESLQDADNIYRCIGCESEITRYTGWKPYTTLEATIDKIKHDLRDDDGSYSWVIKKDDVFIGTIGAYDYHPDDKSIEIGYSIAREFWGNGYARTATKVVVDFLQKQSHIRSIRAWSHQDNIASIRILRSAGLKEICTNGEQIVFEKKWYE